MANTSGWVAQQIFVETLRNLTGRWQRHTSMRFLCLLVVAVGGWAQIQPPEELGQIPGGNRLPRREKVPLTELTGLLRRVESRSVVVEADDARLITIYLDAKTSFDPKSVTPGDTVFASSNVKDGRWTAVEIRQVREGTAKEKARASAPLPVNVFDAPSAPAAASVPSHPPVPAEPEYRPAAATSRLPAETDADGRPKMRRGRPPELPPVTTPRATAANLPPLDLPPVGMTQPPASAPAPVAARAPLGPDRVLVKAREVSATYSSTLPNFIAKQFTTRYERQPRGDFQVQDQVECEVIVENGVERYRDFKRHGRSLKEAPTDQGAWSSGEFRTMQSMVLDNGAAVFFNKAKDTMLRREAIRYQFTVKRESSQWRVDTGSQVYTPAYSGTIWIDGETARVLRIEIESRGIPEGFPVAKAETTIDYDFVALGSQKFLLPSTAALLTCESGTKVCSKNEIQFRHYRTFGAESKITFEEK